jgi:hypothetical protein
LAGLRLPLGDGERPRLARSAVGVLLFSLSFGGGVLFAGLAPALISLGSFLFLGPGDEREECDGDDAVFTGLKLSLSFSLEGVCLLLGLDLDDCCVVS